MLLLFFRFGIVGVSIAAIRDLGAGIAVGFRQWPLAVTVIVATLSIGSCCCYPVLWNSDSQPLFFLLLYHNLKIVVVIIIEIIVCPIYLVSSSPLSLIVEIRSQWRPGLCLPFQQQIFLFPQTQFVFAAVPVSLCASRERHVHHTQEHDGFDGDMQRILRHQGPPPGLIEAREFQGRAHQGLEGFHQ